MDVWRLNLSYDGNWALGFPELGGNLSRFYQQAESYLDTGTGLYQAMRVGYAFEENRLNAAAAGPIVTGGQPMRFTGTPDTEYRAYMDESGSWNEKSRAVTDPYGAGFFYIPGTDTALKIGAYIRFSQADGSEMSPRYTVTSDRPKPEFFPAKISSMDNLRLSYAFQPETSVALERSTALPGFSAIDTNLTSLFGGGYFSDCLPTPAASFYSWRLRAMVTPSLGMMDYYFVPPGVRRTLYPGWNDLLRPGSSFTLDNPVGLATSIMLLITMNAQTSAFLGTAATFSNNQMTYRLYQNAVFLAAYQTIVVPDTKRLLNPPVIYEPTGDISVPVRCLVIGGKNYPMMQFRLAYPDNCADAHWHGNSRVYHVANDNVGITDPNPTSCGYGSYEAIPQVEVKIPFLYWLAYRAYFFGQIAASQPIQLNEAV